MRETRESGPEQMRGRRVVAALICVAAFGLLTLAACNRTQEKTADGEPRPSDAQVERDAVEDFQDAAGLPAPNLKAPFDGPFTAGGMEPFWSAQIVNGKLTFERPESDPVVIDIGQLKPKDGVAKVSKKKLTLIIAAQSCTDASGAQAEYRMLVTYDGDAYEGCARVGAAPVRRDWTAYLSDFLPAIDSCLAKAQERGIAARVTIAYPRTHGHAGVRLSDGTARWECDSTNDGASVKFFDPLGQDDLVPGEWAPLFTRAPSTPPEGACARNVEAKDAHGTAVGWLTYESC